MSTFKSNREIIKTAKSLSLDEWQEYRSRIEHEDNLLVSRTNLFLVVNSLGSVATGISKDGPTPFILIPLLLIINLYWLYFGIRSLAMVNKISKVYIRHSGNKVDKIVRKSNAGFTNKLSATNMLALHLPLLVIAGWLIGAVYGVWPLTVGWLG